MKKIIRNILLLGLGVTSWTYANCYLHKVDITVQPKQEYNLQESIKRGATLYQANCVACHMAEGEGIPSVYPPLAKNDNLNKSEYVINGVKNGINEEISVNGITYNAMMPGVALSNKEIADVLNYVRNTWGNTADVITPTAVETVLKK